MKNMQIEKVERFTVDGCFFDTEKEAINHVNKYKFSIEIFNGNKKLLEDFKLTEDVRFIPVEWTDKDTGDSFFYFIFEDWDGNSIIHWRGFFHVDSLRYIHYNVEIVEWGKVWDRINESLNDFPNMDVGDLKHFISAMTQKKLLVGAVVGPHPLQIYELFTKIEFSPVYIYE